MKFPHRPNRSPNKLSVRALGKTCLEPLGGKVTVGIICLQEVGGEGAGGAGDGGVLTEV